MDDDEGLPYPWWEGYGRYELEWPGGRAERRRVSSPAAAARVEEAVEYEGAEAVFIGELAGRG